MRRNGVLGRGSNVKKGWNRWDTECRGWVAQMKPEGLKNQLQEFGVHVKTMPSHWGAGLRDRDMIRYVVWKVTKGRW